MYFYIVHLFSSKIPIIKSNTISFHNRYLHQSNVPFLHKRIITSICTYSPDTFVCVDLYLTETFHADNKKLSRWKFITINYSDNIMENCFINCEFRFLWWCKWGLVNMFKVVLPLFSIRNSNDNVLVCIQCILRCDISTEYPW